MIPGQPRIYLATVDAADEAIERVFQPGYLVGMYNNYIPTKDDRESLLGILRPTSFYRCRCFLLPQCSSRRETRQPCDQPGTVLGHPDWHVRMAPNYLLYMPRSTTTMSMSWLWRDALNLPSQVSSHDTVYVVVSFRGPGQSSPAIEFQKLPIRDR